MDNRKKRSIIAVISLALLVVVIIAVRLANNSRYSGQIPSINELNDMPLPLREQISTGLKIARRSPSADNIGKLGMVLHSAALYDEAASCYNIAISRDKNNWLWSYCLGLINNEMGDSKAAIINFENVLKKEPDITLAWYYLGKACQNNATDDKARESFNKIAFLPDNQEKIKTLRVNYSNVPTLGKFELARMYMNENKHDEAINILNQIIKNNFSVGPVYRLLGNAHMAKGEASAGQKYITRALDLAEITSVADTVADRIAFISRSAQYLPRQIDDAIKSGNPAWAMALLDNAVRYFPDDKYIISKSVKFHLRMGEGINARPYLERELRNFNDDAGEMVEVSDMLFTKGFYKEAKPFFTRALALRPSDNELFSAYALCLLYNREADSAQIIMDKLFSRNTADPKVLANEAAFFMIRGNTEKAEIFINRLAGVAPADAKVPKLRAMIAEAKGETEKAAKLYESSFVADPSDFETVRKLGAILSDLKKWDKAVTFYRSALKYHPNQPYILERLGSLLILCPEKSLRNTDEGIEYSERAFYAIASPSNIMVSAAKSMAQGYAIKGDLSLSLHYITIAINIARDVNAPADYIESLKDLAGKIKSLKK